MPLSDVAFQALKIRKESHNHIKLNTAAIRALHQRHLNPTQTVHVTRGINIDMEADEEETLHQVIMRYLRGNATERQLYLHFGGHT